MATNVQRRPPADSHVGGYKRDSPPQALSSAGQQFRFVFTTPQEESSLFNIVQPKLAQLSIEAVNPEDRSVTVARRVDLTDDDLDRQDWPVSIPKVTVSIDQVTGQVNVLVAPFAGEQSLPRTPAYDRVMMLNADKDITVMPPSPVVLGNHVSQLPPNDSRKIALSPAGVAIRTPNGTGYVPAGSIKTPNGTIWTPKGVCYTPNGTCYWPKGTMFTEDGEAITPAGTSYRPDGIGFGIGGHVYTPQGTTYSPSGVAYTSWRGKYQWKQPTEMPPTPNLTSPQGPDAGPSKKYDRDNSLMNDEQGDYYPEGYMMPSPETEFYGTAPVRPSTTPLGPPAAISPSIYKPSTPVPPSPIVLPLGGAVPPRDLRSPTTLMATNSQPLPRPLIPGSGRLRSPQRVEASPAPPPQTQPFRSPPQASTYIAAMGKFGNLH